VIATAIATTSSVAHASPFSIGWRVAAPEVAPEGDAARREAAAAFADGEAAFERGEYSLAAARFARAYALAPHRWTLHNLALSRARAGDSPGAWDAFDELVRTASDADERREAERERDALAPLVARIELRGASGRHACIDGRPVLVDADGIAWRTVRPGVHRIATVDRVEVRSIAGGSSARFDVDPVAPRDRARPWLIAGVVAAAGATGVAVSAAALADDARTRGLAGGAAAAAAMATSAMIVALVIRERRSGRRAPDAALDCSSASPP
jgi:hypothetical protein